MFVDTLEAFSQFFGKQNIGQFGLAIRFQRRVVLFQHDVIKVNLSS